MKNRKIKIVSLMLGLGLMLGGVPAYAETNPAAAEREESRYVLTEPVPQEAVDYASANLEGFLARHLCHDPANQIEHLHQYCMGTPYALTGEDGHHSYQFPVFCGKEICYLFTVDEPAQQGGAYQGTLSTSDNFFAQVSDDQSRPSQIVEAGEDALYLLNGQEVYALNPAENSKPADTQAVLRQSNSTGEAVNIMQQIPYTQTMNANDLAALRTASQPQVQQYTCPNNPSCTQYPNCPHYGTQTYGHRGGCGGYNYNYNGGHHGGGYGYSNYSTGRHSSRHRGGC